MTLDLRPPMDLAHELFAVPAQILFPGDSSPQDITVVWEGLPPAAVDSYGRFVAGEARPTLRLRRDQVPTLFGHAAKITAPLALGGTPVTFRIDRVEELSDQEYRVHVLGAR